MQKNIVIEQNTSQNENLQQKEDEIECNISNENENNKINNLTSIEVQEEKNDNNNSENINQTGNNNLSPNNTTNDVVEKNVNTINTNENTNINNQINDIKEKYESNIIKDENKSDNQQKTPIEKIIEEEDEYNIENILKDKQSKNNILKNNQLYFTEANTLITRNQSDIHKSNSNKLYVLTSIPEYSSIDVKKTSATPMKIKTFNQKNKNKKLQINLNNLSPEVYMKKKIRINNENIVNNFKNRIKKYEEDIQKQNEYDYKKAMKECELQYIKNLKNKEKEKQILEEHKKLEEKLKNMEEYRNNLINNKIQNILQKQKNRNKIKKNLDKSMDSNLTYASINDKMEKINNEKILKTLESYEGKLPLIENMHKYELIKMIKDKEEENFCSNTEQRLKNLEITHRKNYLKHINSINDKLTKQNQLFNQRSEKCLYVTKDKTAELEEQFIEKEMIKRYNIQKNILRELSEKKEKVKGSIFKNLETVKEKKELLQRQEEQKIKQILKRLNRQKSIDLKKSSINNDNINNQRIYFSNLQKENLNKANKEITEYYKELMLRREDYFWIIHDMQKDENKNRTIVHKNIIQTQSKKDNEMKSFNKFLEKMEKKNINNQKGGTKMRLYLEKRNVEIESKKKEEEDAIANKQ